MKIVTVVGARPQFIKASVVSRAIRVSNAVNSHNALRELMVHTGQHFDINMSDVFFSELDLPAPDYSLGIGNLSQGAMTGRMLESIETVLLAEKPDCVVVYGDTNSTLAGALAAAKLHIPVAHVEAGLRSFNQRMPEEINRVLTDHVSSVLFAPTESAAKNLADEGLPDGRVHLVGDVMYDAALFYGRIAEQRSQVLKSQQVKPRQYILATIHRAENTDLASRLTDIYRGLTEMARSLPVVFPVHPRTRLALQRTGIFPDSSPRMKFCDPVGYLDMIMLEKNARIIVTDSGGVQKEAYFYRVPCITVRDETEWVELVELGWNRVTPPAEYASPHRVLEWALAQAEHAAAETVFPYGRGQAGEKIVATLVQFLGAPISSGAGKPGEIATK